MHEKVWTAALAGLLHDVGKVAQRAKSDPWKPPQGMEDTGQPVHAAWTQAVVQKAPGRFRPALQHSVYHHNPDKNPAADPSLSRLVALADKLSAGERADDPPQGSQLPQQLALVFDRLQVDGKSAQPGQRYLPLRPLQLTEQTIFPGEEWKANQRLDGYEALLARLETAIATEAADGPAYLEGLLSAFQQAAWCIPSAYYHNVPDISLYDHSRSTAALAACLAEVDTERIKQLLEAVTASFHDKATADQQALLDEPLVLLVGGDLSGVQDFIYTISSKNAARTLRGRSFYLQLLTEAVLRFTLDQLGLPYTNVIYAGGGHFYLLAPLSAAEKLPGLRQQVTRQLLEQHGTALYLAIGSAEVPASGFKVGKFPEYWGAMHAGLGRAKVQRYTELGDELYSRVFAPPAQGGDPERFCPVCGDDQRKVKPVDDVRMCSMCISFDEQIGRHLPGARYLALGFGKPSVAPVNTAADALSAFGLRFQLLNSHSDAITLEDVERVVVWALDDPKDGKWPQAAGVPQVNWLRYTVNQVPKKTFDQLQEEMEGGFKRLGVLRMDVDNLGTLFQKGFGTNATLSRFSTLSFQISLYFEGWVKRLVEDVQFQDKSGRPLIYAVYAGGDDLFLIGPWDRIPGLASKIQSDFARYHANHPGMGISGGMAFIDGKYPVYQAARDADDAEKLAKKSPGKNAFAFLERAWPWAEFAQLTGRKDLLVELVQGGSEDGVRGPRGLLMTIRELSKKQAEFKDKQRVIYGPWIWMGEYQLKRMAERAGKGTPLASKIEDLRTRIGEDYYRQLPEWGFAARWAQLETRQKPKSANNN